MRISEIFKFLAYLVKKNHLSAVEAELVIGSVAKDIFSNAEKYSRSGELNLEFEERDKVIPF